MTTTDFRTIDPSTGRTIAEFPTATDVEVVQAIELADDVYKDWRGWNVSDRALILQRTADIYRRRSTEIASIIALEMGKPVSQAEGEISVTADIYEYYSRNAEKFMKARPLEVEDGQAAIQLEPTGVLLGVMPWNYPHYQVARFIAPNLALGNTVLLKHATNCPQSALEIQSILKEAGLPEGAYINLFASHDQLSTVIKDRRVQGISLTGSERAGSAVAEQAGRHLKKVVLELGGSDPFLVLDTKTLPESAKAAVSGRLSNAGQACTSPKRLIVVEGAYDQFVAVLKETLSDYVVGDPQMRATDVGPLSSANAREELSSQLRDADENGATVHLGGKHFGEGFFFTPALVTDINRKCRLWSEEAFGPVLMVYKVADENEAVELANDSDFGLGAAVFTNDSDQATRVARQLDVGMVFVNSNTDSQAHLPFGGVKRSGFGRELGPLGIEEFANKKLVYKSSHRFS